MENWESDNIKTNKYFSYILKIHRYEREYNKDKQEKLAEELEEDFETITKIHAVCSVY